MTDTEWEREARRLKAAVTRAKTARAKAETLLDKLARLADVRAAELALHQHRLRYYDLTAPRR